jgi:penicillin-binding protein 1C
MLYAGLARLGTTTPLIERNEDAAVARPPRRLLDPVAAWYVGNVLIGTPPPDNAARNRIAFKTGTSYGYRDAWAVGFDGAQTIGVWVGRPDGAPVPGMTGRTAAAPILFDAFARSGEMIVALPPAPKGAIFAASNKLPLPLRRYRPDRLVGDPAGQPLRIMYPPHGAHIELGEGTGAPGPLALKISGGVEPLTVLVNGMPRAAQGGRRTVFVDPGGPGFVRLTVMDAKGTTDSVIVRMQ